MDEKMMIFTMFLKLLRLDMEEYNIPQNVSTKLKTNILKKKELKEND